MNQKFYSASIVSVICLSAMVIGLRNMLLSRTAGGITGIGFVFGGAVVGTTSAVIAQSYGVRRHEEVDAEKIATETLAKLATPPPPTKHKN